MAKIRRVVRRVESGEYHTFDEERWPVNVAIIVLAGFVAGAIIAVSRFDDPRWLYNGWFRLTTLVITTGLLLWGADKFASKKFRRATQLAAVLSLLIHLIVMAVLYNQRLAYMEEQLAEADSITVVEAPVVLPEYHEEEQQQEHEKPVETETPEETRDAPVERQETETETPQESQPTPEPGTTAQVDPSPVEKAELSEAAPRRSDEQSLLSKQSAKANPLPGETIASPQEQAQAEQAAQLEASAQPVERTAENTPEVAKPTEQLPTETPVQRQVAEIARRDAPETQPVDAPSAPALNRAINEPRAVPKVDADTPQPVAVNPSAQPSEVQPNSVEIARQTTSPDVAQQMAAEPKSATSAEPVALDAARQQPSDAPKLASSSEPTPQKTAVDAQLPASEAADAPQAVAQADAPGASPAPSPSDVARSAAESPVAAESKAVGDSPGATPATIAGASIARAEQADAPSVNPQAAPSASPARSTQVADAPASPMNIDSPSVAVAEESSGEAAPTRSTLSKGTAGIAGAGRDVNFDRGEMATRNPAQVPSASANRAEASQAEPVGPALSPSAPALVAKSIAGANVPQATVAAQDVEMANVAGAETPSNVEVSSSAAVTRANASAPVGKITAAAGKTDFDVGPTQIVANVGSGRPAGGGAPEVRLDKQSPQFSRQAGGGSPLSAIATGAVAEAPQAPAGDGGGAPNPALNSNVAATVKSSAGGAVAVAGAVAEPVTGGSAAPAANASMARAAPGQEVVPGPPAPGGVAQPARSVGRVAMAEVKADAVQMSAGPSVGAASPGSGLEASGDLAVKSAAGLPGRAAAQPIGAIAGNVSVESTNIGSAAGVGLAKRDGEAANEPAPTVGALGAPGIQRKSNVAGAPTGQIAMVDAPAMEATAGGGGEPGGSLQPAAPGVGAVTPRSSGALPIQVASIEGPGGLGMEATPNVGTISRQARRDSDIVHAGAARFLGRAVGGPLAIDGNAREPAAAFSRRRGRKLEDSGEYGQPSERTERSVELGLDFLIRHQAPDGSWSLHNYGAGREGYEKETSQLRSDTAATGLALLAFLGAGYDHYDDAYANQIRQALEFLVKNQKPDGNLFVLMDKGGNRSVELLSHGIATVALCEAFGMTGDADLREAAQKAIDYIIAAQSPKDGGWVYTPGRVSDTSVSGWQLMALKSGELAGLKVPKETFQNVEKYLEASEQVPAANGKPAYNPFIPDPVSGKIVVGAGDRLSPATTSMGLLMRLYYSGWNRNDPRMKAGCDFLLANPPLMGTQAQPRRDSYYWYYATQLLFHMRGDYWREWNEKLHPLLVDKQLTEGQFAGSWDPKSPVEDRWGTYGGRIYVTTLNLLSLEVFYRHLPVYEQEAK